MSVHSKRIPLTVAAEIDGADAVRDDLDELYRRHGSRVFSIALHILGSRAAAEEVVCAAFDEVIRINAATPPEDARDRALLCATARQIALARLRPERAVARTPAVLDQLADPVPAKPRGGAQQVQVAVACLPADQRRVVEMAFWSPATDREIADRMGVPVGTVRALARTAMMNLGAAIS